MLRAPSFHPRRYRQLAASLAVAFAALLTLAASAQSSPSTILAPSGVAFDAAGNLYFADTARNQVYESTLGGALLLIAGNGTQGFAGDNGAATAAELNQPQSVAVDASGTIYIADTGNHRIRSISAGTITSFAGSGTASFSGDNGPAIAAALHTPTALAIDSTGALLVCDTGNHRLRRIAAGTVTTIAGNGTQGFSGDNGPATAAQLDTPSGVAAAADGRIYLADTHNDRIRLLSASGIITTLAGTGVRGYSGDNGLAAAASLARPHGLSLTSNGSLLFADSDNHRIRAIDAQGSITTLAGNGTQGSAADAAPGATAALDNPRSVALSTFGSPTFAEPHNHTLRELVAAASLYRPAGLTAPPRMSVVTLSIPISTYGQTTAAITVAGNAGTPQGDVQLLQGSTAIAQTTLTSGTATLALPALPPGSTSLIAAYAGDGINPAATSPPVTLTVGNAIATATADPQTTTWSQPIPALTGSLTGILPQDAAAVSAVFATSATQTSLPGVYPITATLTGPAASHYTLVLSPGSGSFTILHAPTATAASPLAQSSFAGLPLLLSATVASSTRTAAAPTGTVTFAEGATTIAVAPLSGSTASGVYTSPSSGSHSIVATYSGDADFAPSTSAAVTTTVGGLPDFTLGTSGSTTQTVAAGSIATYNVVIASQAIPFTGVVSLSVAGLPPNATASFAPPQVVPGATSATSTLTIQTPAAKVQLLPPLSPQRNLWLACLLLLPVFLRRRRRLPGAVTLLLSLSFLSGCGDRTTPGATSAAASYNLTITGTSTNLAGALVTHTTQVTLHIQ